MMDVWFMCQHAFKKKITIKVFLEDKKVLHIKSVSGLKGSSD